MEFGLFALLVLGLGLKEEIEIHIAKKKASEPFLLHMDIAAAEKYVNSKHPKDIKEAFRIRREAAFAGMFPPKMSKEWYDEHPAEKEFYKEYYDSLSYMSKDKSSEF